MNQELLRTVEEWIAHDPDDLDRATLRALLDQGDEHELQRRFESHLSFGTAGLRGPVMAGPAGMNRYTVRRATQGVVAWLRESGIDPARGVVVGRDARTGSEKFNDEVVAVLLGAGVTVHEMPRPLPTPFVAYAVKALDAGAGIMITASHNPPQDNGYKLYGSDGAQIIPPSDEIVERHALAATTPALGDRSSPLHHAISQHVLDSYHQHFASRFATERGGELCITYTPLHGVGGEPMMALFAETGFTNVTVVTEQFVPDAGFPTLPFPNPEEPGALDLATATAEAAGSSLVIANDPDADRLGVAARSSAGWRNLRGDEIGWLLASALLEEMTAPDDVVATSIVSSTMLEKMARAAGVRFAATLTGFKWISRAGGDGVLRFGYEEALGYAVDPLVADKDGMSAALAMCRLAHQLNAEGSSLFDRLDALERRFGVHAGGQLSLRAEGPTGLQAIRDTLERVRVEPPSALGPFDVSEVIDLARGWNGLAPTDGILLRFAHHGRVVIRPSGTEPKLKAYMEVTLEPETARTLEQLRALGAEQLAAVRADLEALLQF